MYFSEEEIAIKKSEGKIKIYFPEKRCPLLKTPAFTLIEVFVAFAILTVGMVSVFYMFPLSVRQLKLSRILTDMSLFAQNMFEEIKTYGLTNSSEGVTQNLHWKLYLDNITLVENITLKRVILEVETNFEGSNLKEEFATYLK